MKLMAVRQSEMNDQVVWFMLQAEEMAQTFRQRIAQAEAMARADMLRFQPEVCLNTRLIIIIKLRRMLIYMCLHWHCRVG